MRGIVDTAKLSDPKRPAPIPRCLEARHKAVRVLARRCRLKWGLEYLDDESIWKSSHTSTSAQLSREYIRESTYLLFLSRAWVVGTVFRVERMYFGGQFA